MILGCDSLDSLKICLERSWSKLLKMKLQLAFGDPAPQPPSCLGQPACQHSENQFWQCVSVE